MLFKMEWKFMLCFAFVLMDLGSAAPAQNAHDMIMEINYKEAVKRSAGGEAAEDKIVKIDEALGVDLFEGDIRISDEEKKAYYGDGGNAKRSVVLDRRSSWQTRIIPYVLDYSGDLLYEARTKIKDAMNVITSKAPCLTFREKQADDAHYMRFYSGAGCWSYIGKRQSEPNTDVSLPQGCLSQGLIIHEIMHALGFFHEQARPDRDSYVTIFYENIRPSEIYNFNRLVASRTLLQETLYDYESIMHYSRTTFNSNGKDTMRAKFDPAKQLGGTKLSELDILELNKIYQCHVSSSASWSQWTQWTVCLQYGASCKQMRQRFCFSKNKQYCPEADENGVQDETKACSSCAEPMNGHWNNWGSWGTCSKQCDEGTKTRYRVCNNPVPSNGGKQCLGSKSETVICRIKKCSQQWYDTSFEDGFGMWRQSTTDSGLNWHRGTGQTPSAETGPDGDHTTKYGHYAYIEAGSQDHGKVVTLISREFPANFGDACMTFYYNMNGKNMGQLALIIKWKSGTSMWTWDKTGHQGNYWKAAVANIPNSNEPFTLEFEGKIGFSPESDIAIDDVFIDHGKCPAGFHTCKDSNTNCPSWAKTGECHKNPLYMLRSCCQSCSGTMGECAVDQYGATDCAKFAKDYGCIYNGEWMWENCCKSCRECLDTNAECSYWASIGECEKNPTWMKANCKISCKVCKA